MDGDHARRKTYGLTIVPATRMVVEPGSLTLILTWRTGCRSSKLMNSCPAVIVPKSSRRASSFPPATPEGTADAHGGPGAFRAPSFSWLRRARLRGLGNRWRRLGGASGGNRAAGRDRPGARARRRVVRYRSHLRRRGIGAPAGPR